MSGATSRRKGSRAEVAVVHALRRAALLVATDFRYLLHQSVKIRIKGTPGSAAALTTAQSSQVLDVNQLLPNLKLFRLFGVKRVALKKRDDYLSQNRDGLNPQNACFLRRGSSRALSDVASTDTTLYPVKDAFVISSQAHLNNKPTLNLCTIAALNTVSAKMAFAVEKAREPVTESIVARQTLWNPFSVQAVHERNPQINFVLQPVSFCNRFAANPEKSGDFCVCHSALQHFEFGHRNIPLGV
jgi:hypothetical protein